MASIIKDFTITTLNETLPQDLYYTCCANYGDNIYIFGGSSSSGYLNTIYKFNCINKTIESKLNFLIRKMITRFDDAHQDKIIWIY